MLNETFNKKDLERFKTMDYEERKSIMFKLPVKMIVPLYLNYCSRKEIIDLLGEWDKLIDSDDEVLKVHGEPKKLRKRYNKLIPELLKGLKRSHRIFFVPVDFRKKYGFL